MQTLTRNKVEYAVFLNILYGIYHAKTSKSFEIETTVIQWGLGSMSVGLGRGDWGDAAGINIRSPTNYKVTFNS